MGLRPRARLELRYQFLDAVVVADAPYWNILKGGALFAHTRMVALLTRKMRNIQTGSKLNVLIQCMLCHHSGNTKKKTIRKLYRTRLYGKDEFLWIVFLRIFFFQWGRETEGATKVFKHGQRRTPGYKLSLNHSRRLREYFLLTGQQNALYYCSQSANSISSLLFVGLYRTAIVSPYLCGSFTSWLWVQGKLSFSTSLTRGRNEGTPDDSGKRLESRTIPICTEKILFLTDHKVS